MSDTLLPGLDARRVSGWLTKNVPGLEPPFSFRLVAGGRSNLTFAIGDARGRRLVLRRPPLGHVLESAHDMGREQRILSALANSRIPVPVPRGFCEDLGVNGAPFYVMDFVEGTIVRDQTAAEREIPKSLRQNVSEAAIDVLADLHALEPDQAGLSTLGRRDGYVERQLRRWYRQWVSAKSREIRAVERVHELLASDMPPQQRVSIVHGDYRLDNLVLRPDGSIAAVLDWELCTLGDPLADVGMLMVNWVAPGEDTSHMLIGAPTAARGFADRSSLLARYAQRTGCDLSRINYYTALGLWKLACIAEGMHVRYRTGAMGEQSQAAVDRLAGQVSLLAERALTVLTDTTTNEGNEG
jgi:aminoglycoside phosphotransferase (APT) family kinase protein